MCLLVFIDIFMYMYILRDFTKSDIILKLLILV